MSARVKPPSLLIQEAEERLCTCGAGHGSLEGHIAECEWLTSEWCIWGAAVDVAPESEWTRAAVRFLRAATEIGLQAVRADGKMRTVDDVADYLETRIRIRIRSALRESAPVNTSAEPVNNSGESEPSPLTHDWIEDAGPVPKAFDDLLNEYWRIAYVRGRERLGLTTMSPDSVRVKNALRAALRESEHGGEGWQPPSDALIYAMSQWTDAHPADPELGYSDADMIELYNLVAASSLPKEPRHG